MDSNGRCTLCGSKKVDWMAIKVEANVGGGVKIPGQYGLWKWRALRSGELTASGGGRWRRWSHSARAVASGGGGLTVQGRWRSTVAVWLWRGSERRREIRAGGRRWGVAAATAISAMVVAPWRGNDMSISKPAVSHLRSVYALLLECYFRVHFER
nr:hypothetical protein Iba_chr11dCG13790 [Ipomoea batatas]